MSLRTSRAQWVPYTPPASRTSATTSMSDTGGYTPGGVGKASKPREQGTAADGEAANRRPGRVTDVTMLPAAKASSSAKMAAQPAGDAAKPADEAKRTGGSCDRTPSDLRDDGPPAGGRRRKPRQAWAEYVPPGRRGGGGSSSSASSSAETPARSCAGDIKPSPKAAQLHASSGSSSRVCVENHPALKEKPSVVVVDQPASAEEQEVLSEPEHTQTKTRSATSDACEDETKANVVPTPPESQATCLSASAESISSGGGASTEHPARSTPDVTSEKSQERQETPSPPAAADATGEIVGAPSKEHASNVKELEGSSEDDNHNQDQELPPLKPPSARYIPPGRRKALEAEAAAASNVAGGLAAGDGMGPLWSSRAPIRVSQRERPSDRDASPARRPAPTRVAHVVSGGMSAYGANISEYSEEMTREQVEACTAVVSNFPGALPPGQRAPMLQPFISLGGLVVWPRPDEALVTFATPALARQAVSARNNRDSVLLVELLSQARAEKKAGFRRVELARPGRPPADVSSGSRLILGALGIRRPKLKTSDAASTRKSETSKGGIRGRGAKNAQAPATESTDSWDM